MRAYTKTFDTPGLQRTQDLNAVISVPLMLVYEDIVLSAHKFPCLSVDKKSFNLVLMRFLLDLVVKSRLG